MCFLRRFRKKCSKNRIVDIIQIIGVNTQKFDVNFDIFCIAYLQGEKIPLKIKICMHFVLL